MKNSTTIGVASVLWIVIGLVGLVFFGISEFLVVVLMGCVAYVAYYMTKAIEETRNPPQN